MKILVADDTEVMLLLVSRFVESLGHTVVQARDGLEAIEVFQREQPDAVLMDMIMPRMDGIDASRAIKQCAGKRWIPILYVSAIGEESRLADALERGGDDYLVKPVNFRILEAKLKAVERSVDLHQTVLVQSAKLADYYDHAEEEKKVARHLMEQMVNAERLSDVQVHYWLNPAESLSGDLIAVARTPGRVLHVLLADGIGHGLTAALNVLPLTQPFYAMTERGFSIAAILREMNAKVRLVLPFGRFVSVAMVAIDQSNGRMEVWNGGIPPVVLFDSSGREVQRFNSQHVPLGILLPQDFDAEPTTYALESDGKLLMFSDGLIEAHNQEHEIFGMERVIPLVAHGAAPQALQNLTTGFSIFMQQAPNHDDISVALIDVCAVYASASGTQQNSAAEPDFELPPADMEREWALSMVFGAKELRHLNVVPMLMGLVDQLPDLRKEQSTVFLILSELFNNALDHGLLRLDSEIKQQANGMDLYLQERAHRLQLLPAGQISLSLEGLRQGDRFLLHVEVGDTGPGFDFLEIEEPASGHRLFYGRGIRLVRSLCQYVHYQGNGNRVSVYFVPQMPVVSPLSSVEMLSAVRSS